MTGERVPAKKWPVEYSDLYLSETNLFGEYLYQLRIDGKVYDTFIGPRLTWAEQDDVVAGYKQGLTW